MLDLQIQRAQERITNRMRLDCATPGAVRMYDDLVRTPSVQRVLRDMAEGRGDAANLPFAARELEQVLTKIVQKPYPNQVFADQSDPLIPWDTEVKRGAQTYTYYLEDDATTAVFIATLAAGALPSPSLRGASVTAPVEDFGNQLRWSLQEMWAASFANRPIQARMNISAHRAHVELLNRTAAWGRKDLGLSGFLNNANINVRLAATAAGGPGPGGSSATFWDNKTPAEIGADVIGLVRSVEEDSRHIYAPNVIAMPQRYLNILNDTLLSDTDQGGNLITVMEYVAKALTGPGQPSRRFRPVEDLLADNSFGNLAEDAVITFNEDEEFQSLVVPLFFELQTLQETGLFFEIPAVSLVGGTKLPHPLSVARLDGIGAFVPGG